jgi:hypothetical protein
MDKSRQATAEYWREPWGIDSKNGSPTTLRLTATNSV